MVNITLAKIMDLNFITQHKGIFPLTTDQLIKLSSTRLITIWIQTGQAIITGIFPDRIITFVTK